MTKRITRLSVVLGAMVLLAACQTTQQSEVEIMMSEKSAVELRSIQSRAFETGDRKKVYRALILTYMDMGYVVKKVEPKVGTITGEKMGQLKLTASVYPRGEERTIVRANAVVKSPQVRIGYQVDAPEFYQQLFFEPLAKSLFLTALQVEEDDGNVPVLETTLPEGTPKILVDKEENEKEKDEPALPAQDD